MSVMHKLKLISATNRKRKEDLKRGPKKAGRLCQRGEEEKGE